MAFKESLALPARDAPGGAVRDLGVEGLFVFAGVYLDEIVPAVQVHQQQRSWRARLMAFRLSRALFSLAWRQTSTCLTTRAGMRDQLTTLPSGRRSPSPNFQ